MTVLLHGSHLGVNHHFDHTNCQDGSLKLNLEIGGQPVLIGIVFDGCSSTASPEFGVRLLELTLPQVFAEIANDPTASQQLLQKPWVTARLLYATIQDIFRNVALTMGITTEQGFNDFVFENGYLTVVGFIVTLTDLVTFRAGDGIIIINSDAFSYDQPDNMPNYIGRSLLSDSDPRKVVTEQTGFAIKRYPRAGLIRVLVATDGLKKALQFLATQVWDCRTEKDLQMAFVKLFNQGITDDDMAIAFALLEEENI